MTKTINSFRYAINGLVTTWNEELNFRIETFIGLIVLFCVYYFDFTYIESALCTFAVALVLISEVLNTIIEDFCNKVEPNQDPIIKKIKDMSAGLVLLSVLTSVIVALFVLLNHY